VATPLRKRPAVAKRLPSRPPRAALIPWIGDKFRLAKTLVKLIPEHTTYVEPFFGAGHVFFRKPPSKAEAVNDVNGEIANLFEVVQSDWRAFQDALRWALHSRRQFQALVRMAPAKVARMGRLARATRLFYLIRFEFRANPGGSSWGCTYDGRRSRATSFWNGLKTVRQVHDRIKLVAIWNEDFETLVPARIDGAASSTWTRPTTVRKATTATCSARRITRA